MENGAITAVPTPIAYMKGVMDLRGQVIPVIDLRRKFGLPGTDDDRGANIIVLMVANGENKSLKVGVLVDEVSEVITFEEENVEASQAEGVALWSATSMQSPF